MYGYLVRLEAWVRTEYRVMNNQVYLAAVTNGVNVDALNPYNSLLIADYKGPKKIKLTKKNIEKLTDWVNNKW